MIVTVKVPLGSNVHEALREVIASKGLRGGVIVGIGGFEYAEIGYLDPATGKYVSRELRASETILEVTSMLGNYLVKPDGSISIHLHVTLATPSGVHGGHLLRGVAKPFIEAFLIEVGQGVLEVFTHR